MRRRDCLGTRDVLAGDGMLGKIADGITEVAGDGVASTRKNARHTADSFRDLAALAVGRGVSMTTYALKEAEEKFKPGGTPTDEWVRRAQRRAARADAGAALARQAAGMLRRLRGMGQLPSAVEVPIDMTRIPRHDRDRGGGSLVRGRRKGGSQYSEVHMTAQCTARGAGIVMAAARVLPRDTVGGLLSLIGSRALLVCAAAGLVPMLLMDRGFFSAASIAWLNASGADWLMPCRNTPRVVAALREHAAGIRPRVSTYWITDRHGRRARYTMIIERRKKKSRGGRRRAPEEVYVAFAASGPGIRVNKRYRKRWGIETGYRMVKRAMMRTHSKSEAVRDLCFVLSLAAHNAWVMACAGVRRAHRDGWLPQEKFLMGLAFMAAGALVARPRRKPPPEPPPPVLP